MVQQRLQETTSHNGRRRLRSVAALTMCLVGLRCAGCGSDDKAGRPASRPDVLVITIDTLRADRVRPSLTPALTAIGARGASFAAARSTVPLTLPAHVSLFTGTLPPANGVRLNGAHRFDGSLPTLARLFQNAGYDTGGVVGAFVLHRQFGLDVGFGTYDDAFPTGSDTLNLEAERRADRVVDSALAWLRARSVRGDTRPWFLWVHLYDPHAPYDPPPEARARAGGDAYNGEVASADSQIGRLVAAIDTDLRPAPRIVVALGDHGESLGEHGERTHGMLLYEAAVRIPLVIAGPGVPAGIRHQPVSLVDVAPTILRLAGLAPPPSMTGADLFAGPERAREVYCETEYPRAAGWAPLTALIDDRWKIITAENGDREAFDLLDDPGEQRNRSRERASAVQGAAARLASIRAAARVSAAPVSAEARERLAALGYADSTPGAPPMAVGAPHPARAIGAWTDFEDALAARQRGRAPEALAALERLAEGHPGSQVFVTTLAQTLSQAGRHQRALAIYRRAVQQWATDSMLHHDLAIAAQRAGAPGEALKAEQAAIALDPRNAAAHNGVGLLLAEAGRAAEAVLAFERAAGIDPSKPSYLANLGNARRAAADLTGAESAYRAALAVDSGSAGALNGMGVLLVQQDRPADAIPLFERALRSDPTLIEARLNLGIAFQGAGRLAEAQAAYAAVLSARAAAPGQRAAAHALLESILNR